MRTVFTNANVLDGAGPAQLHSTVVVDGDTLASVGQEQPASLPGDVVIDLAGRTVMPGMVQCHMHASDFEFYDFEKLWEYAVPWGQQRPAGVLMAAAIRNCGFLLDSGFTAFAGAGCSNDIDAQLKLAIRDGIFAGPRIVAGSHHINTTANYNDKPMFGGWWLDHSDAPIQGIELYADGPDELRKAVRREVRRGAEIIKVYPTAGHGVPLEPVSPMGRSVGSSRTMRNMTRNELAAVIDTAHELGCKVRGHFGDRDLMLEAVDLGLDIVDHGGGIDGEVIDKFVEHGTFWAPSLALGDAFAGLNMTHGSDELFSQQNSLRWLPVANQAGVKIVLGDDYGAPPLAPTGPGLYARELSVYASVVDALDVLRWGTRNGADLLGMAGRLGTIAPGALADLVIVDGDPSQDITILQDPTKSIAAVMIDGRFVRNRLPAGVEAAADAPVPA